MFSLRIFSINYYLAKPEPGLDIIYSDFRCCEIKQVPVIRIFGSTKEGQKACLHIHNVFPYLLVKPFKSSLDMDELAKYTFELANQIDKVLNIALCVKDPLSTQHVFKIKPIFTKSMYGYHENDTLFLKIYLFNPAIVKKLSELLLNGSIMSESFQTYESHVPYNLQFLMDFNLFGMNMIHLKLVKFRRKNLYTEETEKNSDNFGSQKSDKKWDMENLAEELFLDQSIERHSTCDLELDSCAADIMNFDMDKDGYMLNPGMSALWDEEKKRRELQNIDIPLETIDTEERTNILKVENEIEFKKRLIMLLETRFEAKYPFKNEQKFEEEKIVVKSVQDLCDINQTFEEVDYINDELIADMLEDLHNNTDLENSIIPDDEEEKESLLKENNDLTQIEKETNNHDEEDENFSLLNDTISSDDSDGVTIEKIEDRKEEYKHSESIIDESAADSSISSGDESFSKDDIPFIPQVGHECSYFSNQPPCSHRDSNPKSLFQNVCLNCEFVKEINDSLDHMAFLSPENFRNEKKNFFLTDLNFDSPSIESNDFAEIPDIVNETITEDDLKDFTQINETLNEIDDTKSELNLSRRSSNSLSETTLMLSDSDYDEADKEEEFLKEYYAKQAKKNQCKRKKILDEIDQNERKTSFDHYVNLAEIQQKNNLLNKKLESNEAWFCPRIEPPTADELKDAFKANNEPLVKYYKSKDKFKMKLNLYGFDGKLSEIALNEHGSNEEDLQWFTPALPLPSVRRVQRKISKKESSLKLKKLKKASQLSQTLKVNKTSSQSSTSSQDQIETSSIQSNSQLGIQISFNLTPFKKKQFESKSILVKKDTPKIKSEKKRKSVRFSEKTLLVNEKITQNEFAESNEKSHFTVEGILKDQTLNNIKMNCSIPSTPYSSIVDDFASSNSFNSNTTLVLDEENPTQNQEFNHSINQTLDTTIKPSFYEFDSILFPKASKYVDYLSMTTQDLSNDENVSSKESKKEKKILNKNKENSLNLTENFHLTLMSMEVYVKTRGDLTPDPEHDSIGFISFTILHNRPIVEIEENSYETHLIIFDWEKRSMATTRYLGLESTLKKQIKSITYTYSEEDLVESFVRAVQFFDPDILVGFEIQKLSWCYVARRAIKLKILDFCSKISRLPKFKRESLMRINLAKKPSATTSRLVESSSEVMPVPHELIIAGRVVLNLWRILRSEIALSMYSLENCCFSILHERVPRYSYSTLDKWFQHRTDLFRSKTIEYFIYRSRANLRLMVALDLVGKTCEFARVYGIEFYHVFFRGSQYRVESMMLRIARKLNFVSFTASQKQKTMMRAPECIPLTLEPESKFYTDPVAVLDFQSLYPSVIIAFNICFTTCLGRIESIGKEGSFKFGCGSLFVPDKLIKSLDLDKDIYVAPNGVAFVKPHIRQGILPIMLDDILKTRVMVKNSMKIHKSDENFQKISDARQLSLKLIANVTFGYTAANFSGRMPCVEVGDSIVRVARQALENSIKYIQSNQRTYGGRVVYGDTDSVFVLFEGMKKSDAFKNSYKLVEDITNMNVKPVKLKFEKIYFPCVLLAKKRYLGYMFESPEQAEPTLDVKGIEIIRRDGCQVSAKMLERSCKLLFEFKDVEKVKEYVQKQIMKLVNGKVNLKEFIIAKEYRGREYYDNAKSIAACQVANRSLLKDPLSEPLAGERVPYVIIYGLPGVPLYELVRSPHELIDNPDIKINYEYYVMKQVLPPLDRIMCLMNVNVFDWVKSLSFKPKIFQYAIEKGLKFNQPVSVANFVYSADCVLCGKKLNAVLNSKSGLCAECQQLDQNDLCKLFFKFNKSEKNMNKILKMCQLCTDDKNLNVNYNHECKSLDCPINFIYISEKQSLTKNNYLRKIIDKFF